MHADPESFWRLPYPSQRMPLLADDVVATSQPLAASAGLRMFARGGNAVDAALATAIALAVVEPCMNGIGGDAFALIWDGSRLHGLNASGRAPAAWHRDYLARHATRPLRGWDTVTVPGAVSAWRALSERFGRLPFADLFEPAIRYARDGYLVSPTVHRQWAAQVPELLDQPGWRDAFAPRGRAPLPGERMVVPGQAETLERIATSRGEDFYRGVLAGRIAAHARATGGLLTEADLAAHQADWVEPVSMAYRDVRLHEIGPNGQGIAALLAAGIVDQFDLRAMGADSALAHHVQIEAMKLAFADLYHHVADPAAMRVSAAELLDPAYLRRRAALIDLERAGAPVHGEPHAGGTVYLCAGDRQGLMISLIQSNFKGFGSGVVVPGTGIALQNRGYGFSLEPGHANEMAPGKRPMHTIIPGFLTRAGQPLAAFGVMGASMQPQGHLQVTSRVADWGCNPQAASDAPRWRVLDDNRRIAVEWNFPAEAVAGLRARGHVVEVAPRFDLEFGSAQMVMKAEQGYLAASDHRKDGVPMGM